MKRLVSMVTLGAALAATACAPMDRYVGGAFESVTSLGGNLGAPWGTTRPLNVENSITVSRVRAGGGMGGAEILEPEDGNVWPAIEGPRATLANPDDALRGIPSYRPGDAAAPPPPRRRARGSDAAYVSPGEQPAPPVASVAPRLGAPRTPPQGSTIIAPDGSSRTITGSQGNFGSTIGPSGQTGTLLRDGNITILQEPGRPAQQIITPR